MNNKLAQFTLLCAVFFLILISFVKLFPIENQNVKEFHPDFSYENINQHLKQISNTPHPAGSDAHQEVKKYILSQCESWGVQVTLDDSSSTMIDKGHSIIVGRPQNILATIPGNDSTNIILISAHYDSPSNSHGTGDDGSAISSMLETIRYVSTLPTLKNTVVFLFSDMEELGLLGAKRFIENYPDINSVKLIFNYEARGNAGPNLHFEFSENNAWLASHLSKALTQPYANSFAYEVYKIMPNSTDFEFFKTTSAQGMNSAFLDGFSYYHNPVDNPENLDQKSLMHQASNMLETVLYFAQLNLNVNQFGDAIFFNSLGSWFMSYSESSDSLLILFTMITLLLMIYLIRKREMLILNDIIRGFLYSITSYIICFLTTYFFHSLLLYLYPHYQNFFNNNFYNANYYLITISGLFLFSTYLCHSLFIQAKDSNGIHIGALLPNISLVFILKALTPTASYIIYIPLLSYLIFTTANLFLKKGHPLFHIIYFFSIIPSITLWVPMIYLLFLAFSLHLPYIATVFMLFFTPFLIEFISSTKQLSNKIIPSIIVALLVMSITLAHKHSKPHPDKPLVTNIAYVMDKDSSSSFWISNNTHLDSWTQTFLNIPRHETLGELYYNTSYKVWKSPKQFLDSNNHLSATYHLFQDTLSGVENQYQLILTPATTNAYVELEFSHGSQIRKVNQQEVIQAEKMLRKNFILKIHSPHSTGDTVIFTSDSPPFIKTREFQRELSKQEQLELPDHLMFSSEKFSNVRIIKQTIGLLNHD